MHQEREGTQLRVKHCCLFHLSVRHTSHRIWVAFLALKSSGVSSSKVSPLPFTPSSRSFLYSFYRTEEEQRDCRKGHTGRPGQGIHVDRQYSPVDKLSLVIWAQSHHASSTDFRYIKSQNCEDCLRLIFTERAETLGTLARILIKGQKEPHLFL